MKRLYDFFIKIFSGKFSTQDCPYTYKEIKGNPYTNTDEDGNPFPPWINFPEISPFDFFYRDAGECWLSYFWNLFWEKMSKKKQAAYLDKWKAPESWRYFYDEEWQSDVFN